MRLFGRRKRQKRKYGEVGMKEERKHLPDWQRGKKDSSEGSAPAGPICTVISPEPRWSVPTATQTSSAPWTKLISFTHHSRAVGSQGFMEYMAKRQTHVPLTEWIVWVKTSTRQLELIYGLREWCVFKVLGNSQIKESYGMLLKSTNCQPRSPESPTEADLKRGFSSILIQGVEQVCRRRWSSFVSFWRTETVDLGPWERRSSLSHSLRTPKAASETGDSLRSTRRLGESGEKCPLDPRTSERYYLFTVF